MRATATAPRVTFTHPQVCSVGMVLWSPFLAASRVGCPSIRRDESFAAHEGGLVYACAGQSWPIGWEEIAKVANYDKIRPSPAS